MKAFALVALFATFLVCAHAAVTLTLNPGGVTLLDSFILPDLTTTYTITASCSGPELCDQTAPGWTSNPALGSTGFGGVSIDTTVVARTDLTIDPITFHRDNGFLKFTAQYFPTVALSNRSVEIFVWEGLTYDQASYDAGIASTWVATLVDSSARLGQLPPGSGALTFSGTAPLDFIDGTPTPPLYWGNTYEIRLGLVNTNNDRYCGSTGTWPNNANDDDAEPTTNIDTAGCPRFLEEGDRWTFPAPSQRIPNAAGGNGGYNTATGQTAALNDYVTPLTWAVRGGTGSSLVFDGLDVDSTQWESSCVPPINAVTFPNWPCIMPRYNPDPKVWVVSAQNGTQGLPRVSAISTSRVTTPVVNPTYQGTPRVLIDQLALTNDFQINFEWANQAALASSTGVPQLTATVNVPRCGPIAAFTVNTITNTDGVDQDFLGVGRTATCKQGLETSPGSTSCTVDAVANDNCVSNVITDTPNAITLGANFATNLQASSPALSGVYVAQRPLALRTPDDNTALNPGNRNAAFVTQSLTVGSGSRPFIVSFPLDNNAQPITTFNWNSGARDQVVSVTPTLVYECSGAGIDTCLPNDPTNPDYIGGTTAALAKFFQTVPTLNISRSNPAATFQFSNVPYPTQGGNTWRMYFDVRDAVTGASTYSWSAMPFLVITVQPIKIEFINFPQDDNILYVTQPNPVDAYYYELRTERSAAALALSSINIGFTITPANSLQFVVDGTPLTNQFTFTGTQTVIHFQVIATAPVANVAITFTDPQDTATSDSFLSLPGDIVLDILPNPINIKLPDSEAGGPYVREPFQIEFTWTPPAASAFTITITAPNGIEESSVTVNVNAGDTGVVSQAITPKPDLTIDPSADSFDLVLQVSTSSSAYSVPSIVAVPVYRHSFVVTNVYNDDSTLTVYTSGQKSREYCISTNYPVFESNFTTVDDSLQIDFAAVDAEGNNVPGIIVEPTGNSTGGNNFLTLNKGNKGWGCVTLRADRLFNWDSLDMTMPNGWTYNIYAFLSGSLAPVFQNPTAGDFVADDEDIWEFPHTVEVRRLSINFIPPTSSFSSDEFTFVLGETVTVFAYVDVLPPVGLTYQLKAIPAVTITPSSANLTGAADIGGQWHAWDITFDTPLTGTTYAGLGATPLTVEFSLYVAGPDASFYRGTNPSPVVDKVATVYTAQVVKRTVEITIPTDDGTPSIELGDSFEAVQIALNHPVVNSLTVKLVAHNTNGVASAGLTFDPASVTFTPSSPNSALITVTGNLLGEYSFGYELSGPDAEWFSVDVESYDDWNLLNVTQRTAAGLLGTTDIFAGVTYGPFAISFGSPLGAGESVTISPFGSDFIFTPANFTLLPGQTQAPFSFVFKPQSHVSKAYIFWRVSGPSAWKYSLPSGGRQEFDVSYLGAEIVLQGNNAVIPGVAHEGYVSLPFPASISVTPAVVGGAAITFNPPSFVFTPATGNVIHFTYTVDAVQVFGLASANVPVSIGQAKRAASGDFTPDTTGTSFIVPFLFSGTDAALFDVGTGASVSVIRPQFLLDATYSAGTVLNSVEQDSGFFVIGKWSQKYSIHLASPPAAGSVTLTITDTKNIVEFEFGSGSSLTTGTTATLTFTADNYLQYFRFRFVNLLTEDLSNYGVEHLSVTVSQPFYDYTEIFGAFDGLYVVPALAFSPIPAIYTDGSANGLFAAVKQSSGAIASSWPYADDAQFTLHIEPAGFDLAVETVVVEPSTLEFSKSSFSDLVQGFSIRHTNPRNFDGLRSYKLKYSVRFAGSSKTVDITSIVPQDAQNVLLSRYQVIPKFPHVLSYGWQKASFNISFTPVAHVSFIPRLPPVDGDFSVQGARAAGRVDFEPAVIVAAPGQQVVNFKVKAQPGVDRDQLYYRVDWEVIGHKDDLVNLVESLQVGAKGLKNDENIHFATWHLASAGVTTVSFALIAVACVIAVARNMF